ncbi:unnamed protein product [Pleuronectes platessa]|uniref:Uncharacterized protein n=1 Tax=Pleuronectes platessa TaxID=8262 RepID=A0A9N7TSF3_PLEPL|nr:unnamed protein product [Pleuronectes platessa]
MDPQILKESNGICLLKKLVGQHERALQEIMDPLLNLTTNVAQIGGNMDQFSTHLTTISCPRSSSSSTSSLSPSSQGILHPHAHQDVDPSYVQVYPKAFSSLPPFPACSSSPSLADVCSTPPAHALPSHA